MTGGLIGYTEEGRVYGSYANIALTLGMYSKGCGALVGQSVQTEITNSFASGEMSVVNGYLGGLIGINDSSEKIINCFRSTYNLFSSGNFCYDGKLVDAVEFYSKEFYLTNDIFTEYISESNLEIDSNAVWVLSEGELPKLYWEK